MASVLVAETTTNEDEGPVYELLTPDGGVKKAVLRSVSKDSSEENESSVSEGDTCTINYTGFLERTGEEFDSTTYSSPFKFVAGKGNVVKGFDIAVLSMKVGETSRFVLASSYAYGDGGCKGKGMAPDILPGDTLIFEISLESNKTNHNELSTADAKKWEETKRLEELRRLREIKRQEAELEKLEKLKIKEKTEQIKREKEAKNKKKKKSKISSEAVDIKTLDRKAIKGMKSATLKSVLKRLGMSTQGNKKELIKRLETEIFSNKKS